MHKNIKIGGGVLWVTPGTCGGEQGSDPESGGESGSMLGKNRVHELSAWQSNAKV